MAINYNNHNIATNGTFSVCNLQLCDNTIKTTNTNGNLILAPNGTGGINAGSSNNVSACYSVISGGRSNCASGSYSTVGGGCGNTASGTSSIVSGGIGNIANRLNSTVSGGTFNIACCDYSTASGGVFNVSGGYASIVSGGSSNSAYSTHSSISGGSRNFVNARHGSINGGHCNVIKSPTNECCSRGATIGGGIAHNTAGGTVCATTGDITGPVTCCNAGPFSTIGGGLQNRASEFYSTVGGGRYNFACGIGSTIGGGLLNTASCFYSTISGGSYNTSSGYYSTIGGGTINTASANRSTISGGYRNFATAPSSTVSGGYNNTASGNYSTVSGGFVNCSLAHFSTVSGGCCNTANGSYSSIAGGKCNNDNGCCNVHILGSNITATAANTAYTENLHVTCSLKINKFDHTNLSVASSFADTDVIVAVIDPAGTPSTQSLQGSVLRSSLLNQSAQLQFRQGTNAERQSITPASGEPIWTTNCKEIYIGDGTTCGGIRMGPSMHKTSSGCFSIIPANIQTVCNTGNCSVILGGNDHCITSSNSVIPGGHYNVISGNFSTVSGGQYNGICNCYSTISGGYANVILNTFASNATIIGGKYNVSNGLYSVVLGGYSNLACVQSIAGGMNSTASGYGSIAIGGNGLTGGNTASAYYSTSLGGAANLSSGQASLTIGGQYNTASAQYSAVIGGGYAKASRYGEVSHAAGRFSQPGDAQYSTFILRRNTTNNSSTELFLNGSSARMTLTPETTWCFTIKVSAYNDSDNISAWWFIRGGIRRNASGGTSLIGSIVEDKNSEDTMSGALVSVTADDTNDSLKIAVTGLVSKNIRWVAVVDVAQVSWGTP